MYIYIIYPCIYVENHHKTLTAMALWLHFMAAQGTLQDGICHNLQSWICTKALRHEFSGPTNTSSGPPIDLMFYGNSIVNYGMILQI